MGGAVEPLLDAREVRRRLGDISYPTLLRLVRSGVIPAVQFGRRTRLLFREDALAEAITQYERRGARAAAQPESVV